MDDSAPHTDDNHKSLLLLIGDHRPDSSEPLRPVDKKPLDAQEKRLGYPLPAELRKFFEQLGPGRFRFGRVFSPLAEDGVSELDRERDYYRDCQAEQSKRLRAIGQELLPFARGPLGRVFLLNVLDQAEEHQLWIWESEAQGGDEAAPVTKTTFWSYLESRYRTELEELAAALILVQQAVNQRQVLELSYSHQPTRVVHPYELDKNGNLLVWQVDGYDDPGTHHHHGKKAGLPGWRSLFPALCHQIRQTGATFEPTEENLRELDAWKRRLDGQAAAEKPVA